MNKKQKLEILDECLESALILQFLILIATIIYTFITPKILDWILLLLIMEFFLLLVLLGDLRRIK